MLCLRRGVTLARLRQEHADRMLLWMHDPVVRDGIGLRGAASLEKTQEWIRRALADLSVAPFAVLLSGEHVGNVILDRRDDYLRMARLSIYIGERESRGRGVGTTAVFHAARFAFDRWGLHKLWLTVHEENHAALAAYEKVGFVREGVLRDEFLLGGRRLAALYMGLLHSDFARVQSTAVEEAAS
jgi:RimJ/RimL family protein N-acetyltransferase